MVLAGPLAVGLYFVDAFVSTEFGLVASIGVTAAGGGHPRPSPWPSVSDAPCASRSFVLAFGAGAPPGPATSHQPMAARSRHSGRLLG